MENNTNPNWKKMPWYHILSLNYFLNPLVAFQELLYGIRMPKTVYFTGKYNKKAGWSKEKMVYCEKCNTSHNDLTWSHINDTGMFNWFGLCCPSCGEIIPARRNLFSLIILTLLLPIRYFVNKKLKAKWLEKQPARFENIAFDNLKPIHATKYYWMIDIWYQAAFLYFVLLFSSILTNESLLFSKYGFIFLFVAGAISTFIYRKIVTRSWKKDQEKINTHSEVSV